MSLLSAALVISVCLLFEAFFSGAELALINHEQPVTDDWAHHRKGLRFSGKDVASGKSWETWLKKYTERKEALARGEEVENIDLFPEELD